MKVLVLAPFSDEGLAAIGELGGAVHEDWRATGVMWDPVELGERIEREGFNAVVVERDFLFDETFEAAPRLKVAAICRAATNQIDVDAATARGVIVLNTPGRNANAVAEHAVGLMFAVARRLAEADRYVRGGRWASPEAPYRELRGLELAGRTAGVAGFGATGRRVAEICRGIGMTVLVHDPFVDDEVIERAGCRSRPMGELVRDADVMTLHAPPSEDGRALLDAALIESMRPGAILVNTASAELVDTDALAAALSGGRLGGAGYDIFETAPIEPNHPLLSLDNVVLTPHIGGATDETVARHSAMIAEDLARISRGERPVRLANPDVWDRRRRG